MKRVRELDIVAHCLRVRTKDWGRINEIGETVVAG